MAGKSFTVGFRADLTSFTKDVLEGRRTLEEAVQGMVVAAQKAGKQGGGGFDQITRSMFAFKKEQVQQGRLVGFYVNEIASFTGASREASGVLSSFGQTLIEGAAGGLSFGLALEAIKLGVESFKSLTAEADATLKRLQDEQIARQKAVAAAADEARRALILQQAVSDGWSEKDAAAALSRVQMIGQAKQAIVTLNEQLAENARKQEEVRQKEGWITRMLVGVGALEGQAKDLNKQLAEARDNLEKLNRVDRPRYESDVPLGPGGTQEQIDEAARNITAANKAASERARAERERAFDEAMARLREQIDADAEEIKKSNEEALQILKAEGMPGGTAAQLRDAAAAGNLHQYGGGFTGQGMGSMTGGATAGLTSQALEKEEAQLAKTQKRWDQYADSVSGAMAAVITGHRTMTDVVNSAMEGMLQGMLKYVLQSIAAEAGLTAAKVVEQNAALGPWGWIVGLGEAAAAQAAVMAFGSGIGSAAQGEVLPSGIGPLGGGYLRINHPDEMTLPADIAVPLRRGLASGGGRSVTLAPTYNIHLISATGAREFAREHARTLREEIARDERYGP